MELGWASVIARRVQRQGLTSALPSVVAAVSAMGGAHAQVMAAAELSIAVRVRDATHESIRVALRAGGSLVKTYGPRGTVHLLPRDDLALWCAALDAVPLGTSLPVGVRLEPEQRDDVVRAIGESLRDSAPLDGDELGEAVVTRVGEWADDRVVPAFGGYWPRWRLAIQVAANRGVLAFGENRGSRVTYLDPAIRSRPDPDRALGWLLAQYLATYGPAMPEHYARWLGVRKGWATGEFAAAAARSAIEAVTIDGVRSFVNADDVIVPGPLVDTITLVPHFDPYVIGSFPRERLFPGAAATRALGRGQAGVHPVVLIDGIVGGVWSGARRGACYELTVEPVDALERAQLTGLRIAAKRIGEFLGAEAVVTIGPVHTGAHK